MGYLEPDSPSDVAAYWGCADAMRDRWLPGAIAMRKAQICEKASIMGPRLELDWGDYIAIAENRDCIFWLLAGSEVRANTVMSARKRHRTVRSELVDAGKAVEVRGYPDRLQLLVDLEVGTSVDAVTKFVLGSAASTDCWRAFKPKLPQGSKDLSSPVGVTADPRPG
jgi:hypothetical protein